MVPEEFTAEAVEAASVEAFTPYRSFLRSGEPYASLYRHNTWLTPPRAGAELEWGQGWYYDTTVASKHDHWREVDLPVPTKDLPTMRRNLYEWGYCLIEDGLSTQQCERIRTRVADQAAAERQLGIAYLSPSQQHVWSLVNKGAVFLGLIDHDPSAVQAGPVIERLLDETLGHGWNHFSLLANISYPHCHPQAMHMDQTFVAPVHPVEAPVLVNVMYVLQDVDEHNGGTLLVPGTHRPNGVNGELYGPIPRPINLQAPAGTILVFDGRVLHGGAVNHTEQHRYVLTNSCVKPWIRQQESWLLGVAPEVLARASDKALWRMGFSSVITANLVEGFGYQGSGRVGDANGATVAARRVFDDGGYRHVGELSPDRLHEVDVTTFSLTQLQAHESFRTEHHRAKMAGID